jgi:hypothetical protein
MTDQLHGVPRVGTPCPCRSPVLGHSVSLFKAVPWQRYISSHSPGSNKVVAARASEKHLDGAALQEQKL